MDVGWSSQLAVLNWTRWNDGRRLYTEGESLILYRTLFFRFFLSARPQPNGCVLPSFLF